MNDLHEKKAPPERGDQVMEELTELAGLIDSARYPGCAWTTRSRWVRRVACPLLAGAAAAAVIVLAVVFRPGLTRRDDEQVATGHAALQVASAPAPRSLRWTIPTGIDPAVIGRMIFEIPNMTMPSRGEAGGIEWDVLTISFPPSPDWSISHDS